MVEYENDEERKNVSEESVPLVNPRIKFVEPGLKKFDGIIRFEDREDIYRTMEDLYGMISDGKATKDEVIRALNRTIDMFEMSDNVKKSIRGMIKDLKDAKSNPDNKGERLRKVREKRGLDPKTNPNESKVLVEADKELSVGDYIIPENIVYPAIMEIKEIEERDGRRYELIVDVLHHYKDVATIAWDEKVDEYNPKKVYDFYMLNPGDGRGWHGEPRRKSLAARGIETVVEPGKRVDVSQFTDQHSWVPPDVGYASQKRRHGHSARGGQSVIPPTQAQKERGDDDYKRLRFDKFVYDDDIGKGLERFRDNPRWSQIQMKVPEDENLERDIEKWVDEHNIHRPDDVPRIEMRYMPKFIDGDDYWRIRSRADNIDDFVDFIEDKGLDYYRVNDGRGWHGEPRRKSLAARGIETVKKPGKRIDVSKFIDEPSWEDPDVGYARQSRRHAHSARGGQSVIPPTQAQKERGDDDYKRLGFDRYVDDPDAGKGLERFKGKENPQHDDYVEVKVSYDDYDDFQDEVEFYVDKYGEDNVKVDADVHPRGGGTFHGYIYVDELVVKDEDIYRGNPKGKKKSLLNNPATGLEIFSLLGFAGWTVSEMARYLEKERDDVVATNPPKPIKSKEKGDYTHFRFEEPDKFDKIRVPDWAEKVADSVVDGAKVKMGRLEYSGDWVPQSVMIPKDVANAEDASEIVSKIGSNPPEDVRVPFDVEVVKEPDRIENPHGEDDVGVPIEGVEADGRIGVGRGMTTDVYDDTNWRQVRNLQNTTPGMKKRIEQRYANRLGEDRVDLVDDRLFVRDNPAGEDLTPQDIFEDFIDFVEDNIKDMDERIDFKEARHYVKRGFDDEGYPRYQNQGLHYNADTQVLEVYIPITLGRWDRDDLEAPDPYPESFVREKLQELMNFHTNLDEIEIREVGWTSQGAYQRGDRTDYTIDYRVRGTLRDDVLELGGEAVSNLRENMPDEWVNLEKSRLALKRVADKFEDRDEAYKTSEWRMLMSHLKSLPDSDFKDSILKKVNQGNFDSALSDMMSKLHDMGKDYDREKLSNN